MRPNGEREKSSVGSGGKGGVDQVSTVKQVMEKNCEKNKCVYLAFFDLEKAYYKVD